MSRAAKRKHNPPADDGAEVPKKEAREDEQRAASSEAADDQVAELAQRAADLQDRLLRQQADFDNIRKRLRREAAESGDRAVARFIAPLLIEMDNLEHALRAVDKTSLADFVAGIIMIRDNILSAFANAGVEQLPVEGVFDPSMHEVVATVPTPETPRGTIIESVRTGYRLRDQIIRAAQVVVAAPPAQDAPPAPDTEIGDVAGDDGAA